MSPQSDNGLLPSKSDPYFDNKSAESPSSKDGKLECEKFVDFDQVFDSIKHYGRYQFFMLLVIQYVMLNSAGNYIFMSFAALRPTCQLYQHKQMEDVCHDIAACPSQNRTSIFHSLYEEADFVCPLSHLPQHMQTMQAIGSGVGAILGGHLADMFGRKWVTYAGAIHMCLFGLMGAFSINWHMLALAMFGMGLAYGILVDASMTLASETVGPRHRIVQTLAFQWSLAFQIDSLLAYLTADWRRYLMALNGLCLPVLLLMLFWRESPRWLIQKRRHTDACRELNAISAWNGCSVRFKPEDLSGIHLSDSADKCKIYSLWDLFATKKLALYSMVMIFSALTVEMCVGVIIFDVQILAGNPFLNIAFYGLLRIWVPFFIVLMEARSTWFGRRLLFISSQFLLMMVLLPPVLYDNTFFGVLRTVLMLVGGVVNSGIFFTIYKQYSIELYPTLMRAMAVGAFGVVERVGGALAPQLITMNAWAWQGSALTVTTCIALVSLITGFIILPETRNSSMPDVHSAGGRKSQNKY
ncbi:sugar transporter domain-containing protein [Ditylenchus destructor]|uniref:Sugar transporter domain-containing protein n=1 Tax=Ditylenchus destructor TaxID=166010 RepID=A0AAD4MXI0_9BILA|nr:sugar transporter domain-containing protein [Ditylenchus destructor]